MSASAKKFWILRSLGRVKDASAELERVELKGLHQDRPSKPELALMRNSLTRAEHGGGEAQKELMELQQADVFADHVSFQLFYQAALNSFSQGFFSEALERLLEAQPHVSDPAEELMLESTRLLCLQNLNFPLVEALLHVDQKMDTFAPEIDPELAEHIRSAVDVVGLRELFRQGQFKQMLQRRAPEKFSQATYLCSWVAALPFAHLADVDRAIIEHALNHLTRDADFYLRSYRMQTLVGRAYLGGMRSATSWGDRADRLYLWTWRWLKEPTRTNEQALTAIVAEIESWNGLDVLSADDSEMIHNALEWILIFEPQQRSRWSAILRRTGSVAGVRQPLFEYERAWIRAVKAAVAKAKDEKTLREAAKQHRLDASLDIQIKTLALEMISRIQTPERDWIIDAESGQIYHKGKLKVRSQSLTELVTALVPSGNLSFSEALSLCFGIAPYDPDIHDSKIQNLVVRLRKLFGRSAQIATKNKRIYFETDRDKIRVDAPQGRARIKFTARRVAESASSRTRNERSLSLLLKEARALENKDFSRADLERALQIPKPSLNRYLRTWIERGWVKKSGTGTKVLYRITFFDEK